MRSDSILRTIPSLQSLRLFETSARYLNFSKAAAELTISQPAVSQGIRQLEASLGQPLFVRERRSLRLTTHGQKLYAAVSGGFATIAETLDEIAGLPTHDTVVVGISTALATEWLLPKLPFFRTKHPDVSVDLRCLDRDPDITIDNIDLHLGIGDGNWPCLDTTPLWSEVIIPVCSPKYALRSGTITSAADFLSRDLIHYVDHYRFRIGWAQWLRAVGVAVPTALPSSLSVNDSMTAMRSAENGDGVMLGWRPHVDNALVEGRLVAPYGAVVSTGRRFYAVTIKPPNRRRAATVFRDWLVHAARGTVAEISADVSSGANIFSRAQEFQLKLA